MAVITHMELPLTVGQGVTSVQHSVRQMPAVVAWAAGGCVDGISEEGAVS